MKEALSKPQGVLNTAYCQDSCCHGPSKGVAERMCKYEGTVSASTESTDNLAESHQGSTFSHHPYLFPLG